MTPIQALTPMTWIKTEPPPVPGIAMIDWPVSNLDDADGDGETTCAGDCDDTDSAIGFADIDGDGFGRCAQGCYSLELIDQWGDGWSGAMVTIQVEGVDWRTFEATGSGQTETFCLFNETNFSLVYTAGQWEQDNQYSLFDSNGDFLFSDGPYPDEGVVYDGTVDSDLIDCDDHNTSIYPGAAYLDSSNRMPRRSGWRWIRRPCGTMLHS